MCRHMLNIVNCDIKRKRKRSDSVLWQKPRHRQKIQKSNVITQRLLTDLGQPIHARTNYISLNVIRMVSLSMAARTDIMSSSLVILLAALPGLSFEVFCQTVIKRCYFWCLQTSDALINFSPSSSVTVSSLSLLLVLSFCRSALLPGI